MIVSKLEPVGKQKINVYIDDTFAFWLYQKDVTFYALKECEPITEAMYDNIVENSVFYRAKLKALALLQHMDRTEKELRDRLARESYQYDIIDRTIEYVRSYHYIDDYRYAKSYIRIKSLNKSRKQIFMDLSTKGVTQETIDRAYAELTELEEGAVDSEILAIKKIVSKKCTDIGNLSREERQKLFASLYRKGFSVDNIRKVCSLSEYE